MKLDSEMERLTLEHGTMLGPPTDEERAEEAAKKKLTNKVGHGGTAGPGWRSGQGGHLQIALPGFWSPSGPKSTDFVGLWAVRSAAGVLKVCFEDPVSHSSPCTGF